MFWRRRHANDFNAEIEEHLQFEADRLREEGLSDAEAQLAARRSFGNVTAAQERFYDSHRLRRFCDVLWQDIRFGARVLSKNRGSTIVAILTLALGIGANTAIFSLINAVLIRNLPVRAPQELVLFGSNHGRGSTPFLLNGQLFSYRFYKDFRRRNTVFSDVAAIGSILLGLHGRVGAGANLERIDTELVSGTFFNTLGVNPILGRVFSESDDVTPGGHPIAVASYSWWQRRFASDPNVAGTKVTVGSTVYTIVGVTPAEFFGVNVGQSPDMWIPLAMEKEVSPGWNGLLNTRFNSLQLMARLKPGLAFAEARAKTDLLYRQLVREYWDPQPSARDLERIEKARLTLTPAATGISDLRNTFSIPLKILMAVVAIVLLIACANVANLLLARAGTRRREIATRMCLGAGRWRLLRQLSIESALLGAAGSVLGVLLASQATQWLILMVSPSSGPTVPLSVAPDGIVLAFTLGVAMLTVILFGTAPALHATRIAPTGPKRSRLAQTLVAGQVALSLALLVGSGLFLRSLVNLTGVETGFDKENSLLAGIDPSSAGYEDPSRREIMMQQVEERVASIPGVRGASFAFFVFDASWSIDITVPGRTTSPDDPNVVHNIVGARYLDAMGLPILYGRGLTTTDNLAGRRVAVINETMAQTFFPGVSPIGRTFTVNEEEWGTSPGEWQNMEIVGVVKNAKYLTLDERPRPAAFYPHAQHVGGPFLYNFVVRGGPNVTPEIRKAIAEVDPSLPVENFQPMARIVDDSVLQQRLVAQLSVFFAILAAFLACVGLYGVMSHGIVRRTNEFGIRMAIGAARRDVLRMVLFEAARWVLAGVAIGFVLALAGARFIRSFLFGVGAADPASLTLAVLALLTVALIAAYLPARRATRIDPMVALRYE